MAQLGWQTLEQRRPVARLCLFYKIVNGLVAEPLPNYIQPAHRISRFCHSMTFRQIHTGKNYYKYSFFLLAVVQWNALPASVAVSPSLDVFKAAVGELQHPQALETVHCMFYPVFKLLDPLILISFMCCLKCDLPINHS